MESASTFPVPTFIKFTTDWQPFLNLFTLQNQYPSLEKYLVSVTRRLRGTEWDGHTD
jgi:hypothetical protein